MIKNTKPKGVVWVIGGGQLQIPLIDEIHKLGYSALVTDRNPECVCKDAADHFYPVDIFDISASVDLLFKLLSDGMRLKAVIAAGIDANVTAAILARLAGLPGVDPHVAAVLHNKAMFRRFLTENNLPCPRWVEVRNEKELLKAVKHVGFPLIIKNIDNSASRGTQKFFKRPEDIGVLLSAMEKARGASSTKSALVEELLVGLEQTVETIFDANGKFRPCFITDRMFDQNNRFAVEIGLRQPTALSEKMQKNLYGLVKKTADKLGLTIGAAKGDTIYTSRGPMLLEMTSRLSGGFDCQYLVPSATGKNILRAAILTALGKPFPEDLVTDRLRRVGLTGSPWPKPGKIVSISGIEKARKIPGVEYIFMRYNLGEVITPYVDGARRSGFVIVTGRNEKEARETLNRALETIKIETR